MSNLVAATFVLRDRINGYHTIANWLAKSKPKSINSLAQIFVLSFNGTRASTGKCEHAPRLERPCWLLLVCQWRMNWLYHLCNLVHNWGIVDRNWLYDLIHSWGHDYRDFCGHLLHILAKQGKAAGRRWPLGFVWSCLVTSAATAGPTSQTRQEERRVQFQEKQAQWRVKMAQKEGWFSNRAGTSDDDVEVLGIVWILFWFDHIWVFALRVPSSSEVPVVLLN